MTFENYLEAIQNEKIKMMLSDVCDWIKKEYPHLELMMKWNQPMFIDHGTFIIGFSTAKKHLNIAVEEVGLKKFKEDVKVLGYHQTKMLIQVKDHQDLDYALIKKMMDFMMSVKKDMTKFWM